MQQDNNQTIKKGIVIPNAVLLPEVVRLLNEGHTVTIGLKGFSMRPFLEDGRDKALITKARNIKKGNAVLAEVSPRHYVLHRIVKIEGDNVTLRGDGNLGTEHCKLEDVKGFVIEFYRKGRTKPDKTNGWKWTIYSAIWCSLFPIRRYLLAFYRRIWIPLFGPM